MPKEKTTIATKIKNKEIAIINSFLITYYYPVAELLFPIIAYQLYQVKLDRFVIILTQPMTEGILDIRTGQRLISDRFTSFFRERGYHSAPPGSLLATGDDSVIFTGATITPLKGYLDSGLLTPGYYLVQKCLRTKRLDEMTDLTKIPDWTHYFTMCGVLGAPSRLKEISTEAYELLIEKFNIYKKNLLVLASSEDRDLSGFWRDLGIDVGEDTDPVDSYRWKYGIPGIFGRGINFLLRHSENHDYRELGNLISVEDNNHTLRAYEFGFGLESVLSTLLGFKKPMEASIVSTVIPYTEGLREKYADALSAAVVLYHHGVEPGRGRERFILKRIVKGISYLRRHMKMSLDEVKEDGRKFEEAEFETENGSTEGLVKAVIAYENQLSKFTDYAKNQVHAHRLRNQTGQYLVEKLQREGKNMGILPTELDEIVNMVLI